MSGFFITDHAAQRWIDRVKPHQNRTEAKRELERLSHTAGDLVTEHPFHDGWIDGEQADAYAEIAPGIWLALVEKRGRFTAATCLTRSGFSDEYRRKRNAEKRHQRRAKRAPTYRAGRPAEKERW